jgi:hypothetical protein
VSTSGLTLVGILPHRPVIAVGTASFLEMTNKDSGVVHHPVILRGGFGAGAKIGERMLVTTGGLYSAMRLYERWYTSLGFKANASWILPGDDAILLSLASPGAMFDYGPTTPSPTTSASSWFLSDWRFGVQYFHEIMEHGPDLTIGGYYYISRAFGGTRARGAITGLVSRENLWRITYEFAENETIGVSHTISMNCTVAFDLEGLFNGNGVLIGPPPSFKPTRNIEATAMHEISPCGLLINAVFEMVHRLDPRGDNLGG